MNKNLQAKMTELKKSINAVIDNVSLGSPDSTFLATRLRRQIWDFEEMVKNSERIKDAYMDEYGVYRWKSNNHVPFDDMLQTWTDDEFTLNACREARDKDNAEFIAEYKESMKDHEPDGEELFEMRAAFGEDVEVVNVFTGKVTKL